METDVHAHNGDHSEEKESIWYTYVGTTGASTVAFLYILGLAICIYIFIKWG